MKNMQLLKDNEEMNRKREKQHADDTDFHFQRRKCVLVHKPSE